ncbi:MAG: hypothetical protein NZM34_03115 [Bernardetiaceae bacterium]|nr:hypothetical protein [Bernardetiaceae bacterium]
MKIFFYPEEKMFEISLLHYFEETELFKKDLEHFLKVLHQWKPTKNIWDMRAFQIVLDNSLQAWIDEHINRFEVAAGVIAEAFVINPNDLITELGVEQVMSEEYGNQIVTRMFSNKEQAFVWLKNFSKA